MNIGSNASEDFNFLRARHFRAARVLLDWTQEELARKAGIVRRTIVMLESGECRTQPRKVRAVLAALQAGGISFACSVDGEVSLTDENSKADEIPPPSAAGLAVTSAYGRESAFDVRSPYELPGLKPKPGGQSFQIVDGDISQTALDAAYVGAVNSAEGCERILTEILLGPDPSQVGCENLSESAWMGSFHARIERGRGQ